MRLILAAAVVWAGVPASAQQAATAAASRATAAPVPRLGVLPGIAAPALSGGLLAAPSLRASPALSILPPARGPAAIKPASLNLSAAQKAVVEFGGVDLARAPADSSKAAAETLMASVLGAPSKGEGAEVSAAPSALPARPLSAPDARAPEKKADGVPPAGPRTYLLSKPLEQAARLGFVAQALHYILETAMQFVKAGLVWQASGSLAAGLGVLAFELIKMPPMITAQSLADLGLRYWWVKRRTLHSLAASPGVSRVRVLTTGEAEFKGILAVRKRNTGLIFMDSDAPLPAGIPGFGAPIPVADLSSRRVRLELEHGGQLDPVVWSPTLGELLSGAKVPQHVAAAWRKRLSEEKKGKSALGRLFELDKGRTLKLEAALDDGAGGETRLGTVAFGGSVKSLIGLGRWDRVRALFGGEPRPGAIPISDSAVERGGEKKVAGLLRRGWRRLTGALIVR